MLTPGSINEPLALPEGGALVPVLTTIQPAMAVIGGADVTLQCVGQNFTPEAFITFNGGEEPTTFASGTKVTTIVKPSTAGTAGSYPVTVVTPFGETEAMMFEFQEPGGVRATADPDELEDEIEAAGEDGDFKSMHRGRRGK
jgi:hypothetical protein